jgi:hypothetical protein
MSVESSKRPQPCRCGSEVDCCREDGEGTVQPTRHPGDRTLSVAQHGTAPRARRWDTFTDTDARDIFWNEFWG